MSDDGPDPDGARPGADLEARYGGGPRLSPVLVTVLVTIPVLVIAGFIVYAASRPDPKTPVESYSQAQTAASGDCARLIAAVPRTFDGFAAKEVDGSTVKWRSGGTGDPVTLRCGTSRPSGLSPTSNLQVIDPVQWLITDTVEGAGQAYVCVDHRPYVALWVPANAGNGPITDVSGVIDRTLPRAPLDFG